MSELFKQNRIITPPLEPAPRLVLFDPNGISSEESAAAIAPSEVVSGTSGTSESTPPEASKPGTLLPGNATISHRAAATSSLKRPSPLYHKTSQTYWSHKAHPTTRSENRVPISARETALRQYGNFSLAYSATVQPRLEYFGDESGFMAFARRAKTTFVLGDPVTSPDNLGNLLDQFLAEHPQPSFIQISSSTAQLLSARKFRINEMGVDTRLNLNDFHFTGKSREWLRYADNWVSKRGYKIEEFDVSAWESEVEAVSESWRGSRTIRRKEVRFLNRPIVMEDEPGVRRFGLFSTDQRLEAFIFFDPLFLGDQINGYVTCIKRRLPAANGYLESAIMKRAIEVFKSEAVPYIWLGLSPFANIQNQEFRCNRPLDWISRYSYSSNWFNRYLYNFKGHSEYKRRYQGEEFKVYYASRSQTNVLRLMTLASLCGAF